MSGHCSATRMTTPEACPTSPPVDAPRRRVATPTVGKLDDANDERIEPATTP
jgi:hypothetical protein